MESPSLELTNGAVGPKPNEDVFDHPRSVRLPACHAWVPACPTLLAQFYISTVFNHCQRMHGLKLDAPFDSTETAAAAYPSPPPPRTTQDSVVLRPRE